MLTLEFKFMDYNMYMDGSMQGCIISSALAVEILQSYTKPMILGVVNVHSWLKLNHSNFIFDMLDG